MASISAELIVVPGITGGLANSGTKGVPLNPGIIDTPVSYTHLTLPTTERV